MFDVGWPELLVIAIVLIVVVGPKDLPQMLRQFGRTTSKLRAMAGDFRKQFDEALKEAELDDVKDFADQARSLDPRNTIRKHLSPFEQAGKDIKAGVDQAMKPKVDTSAEPASPVVHEAEPAKTAAVQAAPKKSSSRSRASKPAAKSTAAKSAAPKAAKTASGNGAGAKSANGATAKPASKSKAAAVAGKVPAAKARTTTKAAKSGAEKKNGSAS